MKKMIFLFLLALTANVFSGGNVKKIVKEVQKKYKDVMILHVDFKQINRFKLTGIENEIYGTLWLSHNDQFRLDTEDQTIVSNGSVFWRYNKLENQVLIDHAKKTEQDIFLNNFLFKISDLYYHQIIDEYNKEGNKIYTIKLTPKNPDESFFNYIKIWIVDNDWEIEQVTYVDYNENESVYEIENMEIDPGMVEKTFELEIPEGAEVIDLRF